MTWEHGEYHPKQDRARQTKQRLLDAALTLFSTVGYHGTNAKAIAARAGVATGSFYRCFRDKKAAFLAVCRWLEASLGDGIFEAGYRLREEGCSERDVLLAIVELAVGGHRERKEFIREVTALQMMDPDVAVWTQKRARRVVQKLIQFLLPRRDQYRVDDLEAAAELLYYTLEALAHRSIRFDPFVGHKRLMRQVDHMLSRYLFGESGSQQPLPDPQ